MNGNEFWCRAFLSAMGAAYLDERLRDKQHQMVASYCHDAADAALEEAAQRGLVDAGTAADVSAELERIADDIDETIAESSDLHAAFRGFSAGLRSRARGVHVPVDQSRPQPELVRVAFKTATDAAPLRPAEEIARDIVLDPTQGDGYEWRFWVLLPPDASGWRRRLLFESYGHESEARGDVEDLRAVIVDVYSRARAEGAADMWARVLPAIDEAHAALHDWERQAGPGHPLHASVSRAHAALHRIGGSPLSSAEGVAAERERRVTIEPAAKPSATPLRPAEEIALEMVVDAGWIQLGTDGVRLASDVAVPSARDILTRLIEQSRAEGAAAERRAPSTQESAPPPIQGPTARDAVAGMLLRYDFENTADMLAHGCITPTQAADIIRRPSDAGARDCIAALEALAATEPPRS